MKTLIIVLIILIIIVVGYYLYYSKPTPVNITPAFTQEDLTRGWYYGEAKRNGTPDTWTLELKGTRSVRWVSGPGVVDGIKILTYNGITYTAPNTVGKRYYVYATKDSKVIWEKDKDFVTTDNPKAPNRTIVTDLKIQNVLERDLDSRASNLEELKKYIGKPALVIYKTSSSPLGEWEYVDLNTGMQIAFIAFN